VLASRVKQKDVARFVLLLIGVAVSASAFMVSEYQDHWGGSWFHAFLVHLPVSLAMTIPVGVFAVVAERDRGDQMPEALWAERPPSPTGDPKTYCVSRSHRVFSLGFFVCMFVSAPFFAVAALLTGPGVTIFVGSWVALLIIGFRSWWRSSPFRLTLDADDLRVLMSGGAERTIPVSAVSEIRWRYWGGDVMVRYEGGTLNVPRQVKRLDDLVVELRRRNPNIHFDGKWPPPGRRRGGLRHRSGAMLKP
jgi:hypothetical protein